jgi:Arc/MetJ-type ribon-helix-helix transcriptional regulator
MLDRPDAATLLKAMAATLSDEVLPTTSGGTRHAVRVVANLCRILEREVTAGPTASEQTRQALSELLDRDATLPELIADLDRALRDSETGDASENASFDARVREVILADVERRLAIDRPGYAS